MKRILGRYRSRDTRPNIAPVCAVLSLESICVSTVRPRFLYQGFHTLCGDIWKLLVQASFILEVEEAVLKQHTKHRTHTLELLLREIRVQLSLAGQCC